MRRFLASLLRTAMIHNEAEYQEASKRLGDELKRLGEHRARLKEAVLGTLRSSASSIHSSPFTYR
jgi:hypothetical protein